jgi:hypothetical protein
MSTEYLNASLIVANICHFVEMSGTLITVFVQVCENKSATGSMYPAYAINVKEYRRGNQKWTIQKKLAT